MTISSTEMSSKSTRSGKIGRDPGEDATASSRQKSRATTRKPLKAIEPLARITKHAQLISLLGRPEGASIEEMMQATNWQQHSVRGFLAGTVKKKLGLPLTSCKSDGETRRYRIMTRRGR